MGSSRVQVAAASTSPPDVVPDVSMTVCPRFIAPEPAEPSKYDDVVFRGGKFIPPQVQRTPLFE